jgi:hypothetical protein
MSVPLTNYTSKERFVVQFLLSQSAKVMKFSEKTKVYYGDYCVGQSKIDGCVERFRNVRTSVVDYECSL